MENMVDRPAMLIKPLRIDAEPIRTEIARHPPHPIPTRPLAGAPSKPPSRICSRPNQYMNIPCPLQQLGNQEPTDKPSSTSNQVSHSR